jgi:hypothetical protein
MTKPVARDEQMYCTAGTLLSQGHLPYRDFSYPSQLPYHPALLATVYRLTGTQWYLLVGRLTSVTAIIITLIAMVGLYGHVFKADRHAGTAIGLIACTWVVFNPLVDYAFGHAWNHDIVVMCIMVALALATPALQRGSHQKWWMVVAVAALLTLASWMRVTTVLIFAAFTLVLGFQAWRSRGMARFCFLCSMTTLLVSLWPLSVVVRSARVFFINLIEIPRLYGQWLHDIGRYHPKGTLTRTCLTQPGMALLLVSMLLLWAWMLKAKGKNHGWANPALVLVIPILLTVIAFIPPTMWIQYWAIPVPFLVAGLAWPLSVLWTSFVSQRKGIMAGLIGMTLVLVALTPPPLLRLVMLSSPHAWPPVHVHRTAQTLARSVPSPRLMLTLTPLWALEGGGVIYPELAAGSITYRVADQLSPEKRILTHTIGPESLASLTGQRPPSAILIDCEDPHFRFLEAPLEALATDSWSKKTFPQGPTALLAP